MFKKFKRYFIFALVFIFITSLLNVFPIVAHDKDNKDDEENIIIDNTDKNYFEKNKNNSWTSSNSISGYYGSDYFYGSQDQNSWAKWKPHLTRTGEYEVFMRWTSDSNRADAVPVEIHYEQNSTYNTTVNQKLNGGQWISLGTFQLQQGSSNYVKITCSDFGYTIADAVKFVYKGSEEQEDEELNLEVLEIQPNNSFELTENMFDVDVNITTMSMPEFISKIDEVNGKYDIVYVGNKLQDGLGYYDIGQAATKLPQGGNNGTNSLEYYSGNDITIRNAEKIKEFITTGQLTIFDDSIFTTTGLNDTKLYNSFAQYRDNTDYLNFVTITNNMSQVTANVNSDGFLGKYYDWYWEWSHGRWRYEESLKYQRNETSIDFDWGRGSPDSGYQNGLGNDEFTIEWTGIFHADSTGEYKFTATADDGVKVWVNNDLIIDEWQNQSETQFDGIVNLTEGQDYPIKMKYYENYGDAVAKLSWITPGNKTQEFKNVIQRYISGEFAKRPILNITDTPVEYTGLDGLYQEDNMLTFGFDADNTNLAGNGKMTAKLFFDVNGDGIFRDDELFSTLDNISSGTGFPIKHRISGSFTGALPWKIELIDRESGAKSYKVGYTALKGEAINVRVLQLYPDNNKLELDSLGDLLSKDGEFNIQITKMHVNDFDENYPNPVNGKPTILNGNYDMIVLGFNDMYENGQIWNVDAVNAIKDFISTGQSVMFTHDTLTYDVDGTGWGSSFTKYFRDLIGQNIYKKDPLNPDAVPLHDNRLDFPGSNKNSYGFTTKTLDRAVSGRFPTSTTGYRLNEGLLTVYPYIIDEISIATTHHQYFQLDLEDSDVIPWYTLKGNGFNQFDGRNEYYTYTKGNITYSGTGHSEPSGIDEQKLFVNTIIKATRGANHAPVVNAYGISDGMDILQSQENIDFSFRVKDIDLKDEYFNAYVYIYTDKNNDGEYSEDEKELVYTSEDNSIINDELKEVSIPKNVSSNFDTFKLELVVMDASGAKTSKVFDLNHKNEPKLELGFTAFTKGYLVGDTANIKIDVIPKATDVNAKFDNIDLSTTLSSSNFDVSYDSEIWNSGENGVYTSNLYDVEFSDSSTPSTQARDLSVVMKKEGQYIINNNISYDRYYKYGDQWVAQGSKSEDTTYSLSVKSGTIDISVADNRGRSIKNVPVTVKRVSDNSEYNGYTNNTGVFSITNMKTDEYVISVGDMDGYEIITNEKRVNLSYEEPSKIVNFEFGGDPVSHISISDLEGNNKLLITKYNGEVVDSQNTINLKTSFKLFRPVDSIKLQLSGIENSLEYNSSLLLKNSNDELMGVFSKGTGDESNLFTLNTSIPKGEYSVYFDLSVNNSVSGEENIKLEGISLKGVYVSEYATYTMQNSSKLFNNDELDIDVEEIEGLPKPESLSATVDDTIVSLTWEAVDGAVGYILKRRAAGTGEFSILTEIGNINTYIDTSIENGKTYEYIVIAKKGEIESEPSDSVEVTIEPVAPTNLSADIVYTLVGGYDIPSVRLIWTKAVGAESYIVNRRVAGTDSFEYLVTLDNVNFYLDTDVQIGMSYEYIIIASNSGGLSQATEPASITVLPGIPTVSITSPVNRSSFYQGETVTITASGTNCNHIALFVNDVFVSQQDGNAVSFDYSFMNAGDYSIVLKARNTEDASDAGSALISSDPISITIVQPSISAVPNAPTNLVAQAIGESVLLNWDKSEGFENRATSYIIMRKLLNDDSEYTEIAAVGDVDKYTDTYQISNGFSYSYYLVARNDLGDSEPSNMTRADIRPTVPKNFNVSMDYDENAYPNAKLTWEAPDCNEPLDGFKYNVYRIEIIEFNQIADSLAAYGDPIASGITETEFTDELVFEDDEYDVKGKVFHYVVTALNVDTESDGTGFYDSELINGIVVIPDTHGLPLSLSSKVGTQKSDEVIDDEIRFLSGDYVPVVISFTPDVNIKDPVIFIDMTLRGVDDSVIENYDIQLAKVNGDSEEEYRIEGTKVKLDKSTEDISTSINFDEISDNKIKIEGTFLSGEEIQIKYLVKVVPNKGNMTYSNDRYNLTFTIVEVLVGTTLGDDTIYGKHSSPSKDSPGYSGQDFAAELIIVDPKILR